MTLLPICAAFDFDGTISYRDTLLSFCRFVKGNLTMMNDLALSTPSLLSCLLKSDVRQCAKEALINQFFKDTPIEELENYGKQFAEKKLPQLIKPHALKQLKWHQEQGHRCLLVSANLDVYLKPWGQSVGFHDIITSRVATKNGFVTGKLIGKNVRDKEKVRLLTELLGPKENYILYAYGDSSGDKELLEFADKPFYRQFH